MSDSPPPTPPVGGHRPTGAPGAVEAERADHVGQRVLALVSRHPTAADAALGLVLFALALPVLLDPNPAVYAEVRDGDALGVVLVAAMTLPLAWRRRAPITVLALAIAAIVPFLILDYADSTATLGGLIALYSVGAHCERRRAITAAALAFVPFAGVLVAGVLYDGEQLPPAVAIGNVITYVGAFAIGDALRTRRAYVDELRLRVATADRLREEEAARAVAGERARIARELHDVVAHGVSVMVVQAAAARRVLERRPDQAAEALDQIERTGRESMTEMRHLLGVLRQEANGLDGGPGAGEGLPGALAPQPGLDALPELVAGWVDRGLPVTLHLEGCEDLPPGPDLAAYRIVQESLTNVAKHAGAVTEVEAAVTCDGDVATVTVTDDGRGAASGPDDGGYGVLGMRERAELYGGEVQAGPRAGGGWRVRAELPVPGVGRADERTADERAAASELVGPGQRPPAAVDEASRR